MCQVKNGENVAKTTVYSTEFRVISTEQRCTSCVILVGAMIFNDTELRAFLAIVNGFIVLNPFCFHQCLCLLEFQIKKRAFREQSKLQCEENSRQNANAAQTACAPFRMLLKAKKH